MLQMCLTCDAARSSTIICLSSGAAHLKGVIGGQADGETASKEGGEGVAVVVQEEGVVGEGGHAQANLGQVVEVLQGWGLAQIDAVGDVVAEEHGGHQVVHIPSLACSQHDISLHRLVFALSGARLKRCLLCLVLAWSGAVLGSPVVWAKLCLIWKHSSCTGKARSSMPKDLVTCSWGHRQLTNLLIWKQEGHSDKAIQPRCRPAHPEQGGMAQTEVIGNQVTNWRILLVPFSKAPRMPAAVMREP